MFKKIPLKWIYLIQKNIFLIAGLGNEPAKLHIPLAGHNFPLPLVGSQREKKV